MTQQVLDRTIVARPTYETFITDVIQRGWLRYYEQNVLEIAQSAQRLTRFDDLRTEHHEVAINELEGIPVAHVGQSGFVYVIHEATGTDQAAVRGTIIPWYIATQLTFQNIFFGFHVEHVGKVLYSSRVRINGNCYKVTH